MPLSSQSSFAPGPGKRLSVLSAFEVSKMALISRGRAGMAVLALFVAVMGYLTYSGAITMVGVSARPARGGPSFCSCFLRARVAKACCRRPAGGRAAGAHAHSILAGSRSTCSQDGLKRMAVDSEDYLKKSGPTGKFSVVILQERPLRF